MLTLINKTYVTSYVPAESISIEQTAGDPVGKATFQVIDPGSLLSLTALQEVIFIDETVALTPSSASIPAPFTDSFASNDISSYTSTFNPVPPGSLASWTISGGLLTASGGAYALLTVNTWLATDVTVSATMTQSDWGGIAFNVVNTQNYYDVAISDASSPGAGLQYAQRGLSSTLLIRGRAQLYKTVNGVRSALGASVPIPFVRGTSHVITVTAANNGTSSSIGVAFDGVQVIGYTDSSSPLGIGSVGLRNDTVSGASSSIYDAFSATSNDLPVLVASVPAHNYIKNNNFNYGGGGWSTVGGLAGDITFPSSGTFGSGAKATMTISNAATNSNAQTNQSPGVPYVIPGQSYCFSGSMNIATPFVGGDTFIQILIDDGNSNILAFQKATFTASTGGYTRVSITANAPAGSVFAQIAIGIETNSATNSGSVAWTAMQFEPVWFPALYGYPSPICDFLQSDCVTLPDGTTSRFDRIFCGNITHTAVSYEGTTRTWDIEATNLAGILENATLVNATYNGVTDQSILTGIVNSLPFNLLFASTPSLATATPQALAYRNVPICYSGVTVADLQFADNTLREVLNALADITGFLFGVDAYYNVFYYPPFYNQALYGFAGNGTQPNYVTTFPYYDYSLESDASQIQSAINVAGTDYQLQIVEAWHAQDGSHTETVISGKTAIFDLFHNPIAVPSAVVIGGSTISCGQDTNVGFGSSQSLCNFQVPYISLLVTISAGTSISITYTYDALVYVQVRSPDSIAAYGRPLYSKINDTNLVSNAQATTEGEAQLTAYAQPRVTLKFKTTKLVTAGQTIEFTSTLDGITRLHYTIQKTTATYLGNAINQYDIEAGIYVDDFVDFFRNSQKAINRADHDPAEPIKTYNNLQMDATSYTDSLSIHP